MSSLKETKKVCEKLIDHLEDFKYGIPRKDGKIHHVKSAKDYEQNYHLLSPDEFVKYGGGVCWDYVEYEEKWLKEHGVECRKFYIITETPPNYDTHTIVVVSVDGKHIWVESSFKKLAGVHICENLRDIFKTITWTMFQFNGNKHRFHQFKYSVMEFTNKHPKYGCDCDAYMDFMVENARLVFDDVAKQDHPYRIDEVFKESAMEDYIEEAAALSRRGVSGWKHTDATYEEKKNFERAMSFNSEIIYLRKEMRHMTKREIIQRLASLYNKLAEIYDNIEEDFTEVPIKTSRLGFARKPEKKKHSHRQYIDRLIYEIRDTIVELNRNFNREGVKIVIEKMMDVWEYEKRELHINDHVGDKAVGNLTEKVSHKILDKIMDSYVDDFYNGQVYQEAKLSSDDRKELHDKQFGIPSLRKYPLTDEKHVLQAVRFFNKAPEEHKKELAKNIVRRAKQLGMDWENWESIKPYLDDNVQEQDSVKERRNDKGETVPEKCDECGAKVGVFLKGEPIWQCTNKKCGKYFGTVECNIQESEYKDKCISYAMGVDKSIYDLEEDGFDIKEDDGDYCVTFDWSKRKKWESYIEKHLADTYWNEYIRVSDITIHFMINENGKIDHVINKNYEENDELLARCNRLCEGHFKTMKALIFSNSFYKKELKDKFVQESVDVNNLKQQCGEVYQQALQIHYGCLDENGERITASPFKDSWKMISTYHSQSIKSMEESKLGVCFEHSFYVAELLKQRNLPYQTFFLNVNIDHTQKEETPQEDVEVQESESISIETNNTNNMSFWHQFTIVPNDADSVVLIETSLTPEKNGVFLVQNMEDAVQHLIQSFDVHLSDADIQVMKQDLIDVSTFEPRDGDTYIGYIDQVYQNGKAIKDEINMKHNVKLMKSYWNYLNENNYLSEDGKKVNEQIQQMNDNTNFDTLNLLNATQLLSEQGQSFHKEFLTPDKLELSPDEFESKLKGHVQESYMGMKHNTLKEKYHYIPLTKQSAKKYQDQGVFRFGLKKAPINDNTKGSIFIDENHIVVAYVAVEKKTNGQRWITALEVSEEYQGHAYGVELLQIAVDDFGATYLSVNKKNKKAFHMYQRYGWSKYDENDHMFFMKLDEGTDE